MRKWQKYVILCLPVVLGRVQQSFFNGILNVKSSVSRRLKRQTLCCKCLS